MSVVVQWKSTSWLIACYWTPAGDSGLTNIHHKTLNKTSLKGQHCQIAAQQMINCKKQTLTRRWGCIQAEKLLQHHGQNHRSTKKPPSLWRESCLTALTVCFSVFLPPGSLTTEALMIYTFFLWSKPQRILWLCYVLSGKISDIQQTCPDTTSENPRTILPITKATCQKWLHATDFLLCLSIKFNLRTRQTFSYIALNVLN